MDGPHGRVRVTRLPTSLQAAGPLGAGLCPCVLEWEAGEARTQPWLLGCSQSRVLGHPCGAGGGPSEPRGPLPLLPVLMGPGQAGPLTLRSP